MANITELYPIRYTQDISYSSAPWGVIICPTDNAFDLTSASLVSGLHFTTLPTTIPSEIQCAVIFNTGSDWFKLNNQGQAVSCETQTPTYNSILSEGNSISELEALTSIPAFANSRLRYAIAFQSSSLGTSEIKLKFNIKYRKNISSE